MLLPVVANSVVDSDWRVASDKEQYVASCCREQRRRFGLASCKRRGTIRCFLLSRAASLIWIGELQVTRDNTLILVVASSIVDLEWRVARDEGQYVDSCCREQRRQFELASCKRRGTIRCFLLSRAASLIWNGELQATRDNTLLPVVASSVIDLDWRVASDEGQYTASCCREQHRQFGLASCRRHGTIHCFLLS